MIGALIWQGGSDGHPPRGPADLQELDRLIAAERLAPRRDRYRAVRLALGGLKTRDIAAQLGRSRDFVQTWAYAYRDGGLAALTPRSRPGRPPKLDAHGQGLVNGRKINGLVSEIRAFTSKHLTRSDHGTTA